MKQRKPANGNTIRANTRRWWPLFLGPVVCAFIIGFVWPFLQGIYLSFCKFRLISDAEFIGLGNYVKAFQDPSFTHAFWYTALFAIVSLALINVLAFSASQGTAQAKAVIFFVLVAGLGLAQLAYTRRKEVQQ